MYDNEHLREAIIKELEGQSFNALEFVFYFLLEEKRRKEAAQK